MSPQPEKTAGEPLLNSFGYEERAYSKALAELLREVRPLLPSQEERRKIPACEYGVYSDEWVERFLRARAAPPGKFHVDKSVEMLKTSLEWRKEHRADYVLRDGPEPHHGIALCHPMGHVGLTKDGCALFVERLGRTHLHHAVPNYITPEDLIKYKVYNQESLCREVWHSPRKLACVIVDTAGLCMAQGTRAMISFMQMQGKVDADNYPEVLSRVYVINTAKVVMVLWGLVKGAFDPKVRDKIQFHGADYSEKVLETIDAADLPDCLEGGERKPRPHEHSFGDLAHLRLTPNHPAQEGFQERVSLKKPNVQVTVSAKAGEKVEWKFLMEEKYALEFEVSAQMESGLDLPLRERALLQCLANDPHTGELRAPEGCVVVVFTWYPHGRSWFGTDWLRYSVASESHPAAEPPRISKSPIPAADETAHEPADSPEPDMLTAMEFDDLSCAPTRRLSQASVPAAHSPSPSPGREGPRPASEGCSCCLIS